jgi:protein TonB
VIRPPPPPPPDEPPPPPPEKPPEQIAQTEPDPTPSEDPSPSEQLGLDAEGTAGGDAFGLAAHKGGHDLVGSGGAIFGWYTARLKDRVTDKLSNDSRLRAKHFSVAVRVWIENDGRIREVHVVSGTGSGELDNEIELAVASIGRLSEPPPLEMPEPVTIRIVSRAG